MRWQELRNLEEHEHLSNTEVSEMVLEEDWPAKLRKLHVEKIQSRLS